ncbi:hypothetical protein ACHAXA_002471 [Cyclostephanos tholiformis]|uniref:Uncharacterized protein n=1 Tax=Cyclostephanos tholiformis TaxID=382380 RepID=A0ABD3RZT7_9STRA
MIDAASPPHPNPNPPSEEEDVKIEHHALVTVGGGIGGLILALYLDANYYHHHQPADSDSKHDNNDILSSSSLSLLLSSLLSFNAGIVAGDDNSAIDDVRLLGCGITRSGILGGAIGAMMNLVGRGRKTTMANSGGASSPLLSTTIMGIRRYRLSGRHDACRGVGIAIHFGKRVIGVSGTIVDGSNSNTDSIVGDGSNMARPCRPRTLIEFNDGSKVSCSPLIGADGINSRVCDYMINPIVLRRTVPAASDDDDSGGGGMFLAPLESSTWGAGVVALDSWHIGGGGGNGDVAGEGGNVAMGGKNKNVRPAVLLSDAAHPPVLYIGQGAMMATKDAGTLAMVLREYCPPVVLWATTSPKGGVVELNLSKFSEAMRIYE